MNHDHVCQSTIDRHYTKKKKQFDIPIPAIPIGTYFYIYLHFGNRRNKEIVTYYILISVHILTIVDYYHHNTFLLKNSLILSNHHARR